MNPRAGLEKGKYVAPARIQTLYRLARSDTLYRLRYLGSVTDRKIGIITDDSSPQTYIFSAPRERVSVTNVPVILLLLQFEIASDSLHTR